MRKLLLSAGMLVLMLGSAAAGFYLHKSGSQSDKLAVPGIAQHTLFPAELTGQLRPDFSLPDINGKTRNISEWNGQVVALNFWATWCPPCLEEIPEFVALQNKYAGQGLQFVGIALQSADEVTDFVNSQGINYPVLVGGMDVISLAERLGDETGTLPYTVIIDRNGKIKFINNGQLDGDQAEQVIKSLL